MSERAIKTRHWCFDQPAWSPDGRLLFVPLAENAGAEPTAAAPTEVVTPGATTGAAVIVHTTDAPLAEAQAAAPADIGNDLDALQRYLDRENAATLAAIDVATGAVRVLIAADATPRPSHLRVAPDGRWVACASVFHLARDGGFATTFDLHVVAAAGGEPRRVAADVDTTERIYTAEQFAWTPDGEHLVFTKGRRLWVADVGGDGVGAVRAVAGGPEALADTPFALTADGRAVLVGVGDAAVPAAAPPKSLALVPLDGGASTPLALMGSPLRDGPARLWQPTPSALHLIVDDPQHAERAVVRVDLASGERTTVWHRPGRFSAVGAGVDGALIARIEGPATPPDLFRVERGFATATPITAIAAPLRDVVIGPMRAFTTSVPGRDGVPIDVQSAVFLPAGAGDRPLPTVVYLYSGARYTDFAQDYGGGAPNTIPVQIFATRGYAVLFVDVPLTGTDPVAEMAAVVVPQVRHAAELGHVDLARVAVVGHSYGGYSAAALLTASDVFGAAIAIDGFYDLPGAYGVMHPGGLAYGIEYFENGQGRMGTHPWAARERYLANSPYHQADRIAAPLLLLHGGADDTCPVHEAEKMFNACKRLGRTAELAVYPGEGHSPGEWSLAHRIDAGERMLAFLARHLAPRPAERR